MFGIPEESIPLVSKGLNTAMVLVILYGLSQRRRPRRHIPAMLVAFVGDVVNVLIIELNRGAIEQTVGFFANLDLFELFHVTVSAVCIVCYVIAIVTGCKLLKTGEKRKAHRINALVFLIMRTASFITSFWMG